MKKIMFSDKYGLTDAVLARRKTMTRRIIKGDFEDIKAYHANGGWHFIADTADGDSVELKPRYEIGEKVAIAQPYKRLFTPDAILGDGVQETAGWTNKMFVKAEYMPNRIRITDIKLERLQDISEEDIYKEGFKKQSVNNGWGNAAWHWEAMLTYMDDLGLYKEIRSTNPQEAFACLIDKLSGYGTWESNPWVYVYTFELLW